MASKGKEGGLAEQCCYADLFLKDLAILVEDLMQVVKKIRLSPTPGIHRSEVHEIMVQLGMKANGKNRLKLDVVRVFHLLQAVRGDVPIAEEYKDHVFDARLARLEPDGTLSKERVRLVLPEAFRRRTSKTHETRASKRSWRRKNHETTRDSHRLDVPPINTPASSSNAVHGPQ